MPFHFGITCSRYEVCADSCLAMSHQVVTGLFWELSRTDTEQGTDRTVIVTRMKTSDCLTDPDVSSKYPKETSTATILFRAVWKGVCVCVQGISYPAGTLSW